MNKRFAVQLFFCGLLLVRTVTAAAESKPEIVAQVSAEKWLTLVDGGKYEKSWEEMSSAFKSEVSKRKWNSTITEIRKPLGKLVSRKLKSAVYTKELPGAPEGEYVTVQFDASFGQKNGATEKVTLMLGQDLIWRVSSYAVR